MFKMCLLVALKKIIAVDQDDGKQLQSIIQGVQVFLKQKGYQQENNKWMTIYKIWRGNTQNEDLSVDYFIHGK